MCNCCAHSRVCLVPLDQCLSQAHGCSGNCCHQLYLHAALKPLSRLTLVEPRYVISDIALVPNLNRIQVQLQESLFLLVPPLYVLHATIILAWVEYKRSNAAGLREYTTASSATCSGVSLTLNIAQMARKIAHSHGLGQDYPLPEASDQERITYRNTRTAVVTLLQLAGSSSKLALPRRQCSEPHYSQHWTHRPSMLDPATCYALLWTSGKYTSSAQPSY